MNITPERAPVERTTVTVDKRILDAARKKAQVNGESLTDFLSRAILNQLEKEGRYDIRYEMREEDESY